MQNGNSPALSPMPVVKKSQPSPRKVCSINYKQCVYYTGHQVATNIFVSPHKPVLAPSPLTKTYDYQFDKSPSKVVSMHACVILELFIDNDLPFIMDDILFVVNTNVV